VTREEWVYVGVGTALGGLAAYLIYEYLETSWPPSSLVQQGILDQILSTNSAMGGQSPTAAQSAQLSSSIAQAPSAYAASLPAGTAPTVAGYQAWMSANITNYVASGGTSGGFAPTIGG